MVSYQMRIPMGETLHFSNQIQVTDRQVPASLFRRLLHYVSGLLGECEQIFTSEDRLPVLKQSVSFAKNTSQTVRNLTCFIALLKNDSSDKVSTPVLKFENVLLTRCLFQL